MKKAVLKNFAIFTPQFVAWVATLVGPRGAMAPPPNNLQTNDFFFINKNG